MKTEMKNVCSLLLMSFVLVVSVVSVKAQKHTMEWGNTTREFLLYKPSTSTEGVPVVYYLHGLGDNIDRWDSDMGFAQLAETWGWAIVIPQALKVQGYSMWNAGLGGTADDAGFLIAILDSLIDNGVVNPDSVFFTGFSMGGFMTHRMAIEYGDRITACAPVSGLISFQMAEEVPVAPVRLMHIHGTSDATVGYDGNSAYFGTIGIGVDSIISYWTEWNGCSETATIDTFPDSRNDGLRFVRYLYSDGDADVVLIKVIGGDHNWYSEPSNDVDYTNEIYKFFKGTGNGELGMAEKPLGGGVFMIYPNPSDGVLNVCVDRATIVECYDMGGRMMLRQNVPNGDTELCLRGCPSGIYLLRDTYGHSQRVMIY